MAKATPIDRERAKAILNSFQGEIEPIRRRPIYMLALLVVAAVMVLLPVIYFTLVGVVGYLMYVHAVHNIVLFKHVGGGHKRLNGALLLYFGPLFAGAVLLLFLLKPFFAPRGRGKETQGIDRKKEPLLYAYVEKLCRAVHAPPPRTIYIDLTANAAAVRRFLWGGLWVSQPSLELGLPLVGGLTLREFSGILAHEFGHFSQGIGTHLSGLIDNINAWFERVVYQRDRWDQYLIEGCAGETTAITMAFYLARVAVWLSRRLLWCLMLLGRLVSSYCSRRMEFDADRYAARFAGSAPATVMLQEIVLLAHAESQAQQMMSKLWADRALPVDYPELLVAIRAQAKPEQQLALLEAQHKHPSKPFDTHPGLRDRLEHSALLDEVGIYAPPESQPPANLPPRAYSNNDFADWPASVLFRDYSDTCRATTSTWYAAIFGDAARELTLCETSQILHAEAETDQQFKSVPRYMQATPTMFLPLPVPNNAFEPPENVEHEARRLPVARERMLDQAGVYRKVQAALADDFGELFNARFGQLLLEHKVSSSKAARRLMPRSLAAGADKIAQVTEALEKRREQGNAYMKRVALRLFTALRLLHVPEFGERIEGIDEVRDRTAMLIASLRACQHLGPVYQELSHAHFIALELAGVLQQNTEASQAAFEPFQTALHEGKAHLERFAVALEDAMYPQAHGQQAMVSLREYLLPIDLNDITDLRRLFHVIDAFATNFKIAYFRLFGLLTVQAEQIEQLAGLPPLPDFKTDQAANANESPGA